jgi:hypothetical protein
MSRVFRHVIFRHPLAAHAGSGGHASGRLTHNEQSPIRPPVGDSEWQFAVEKLLDRYGPASYPSPRKLALHTERNMIPYCSMS